MSDPERRLYALPDDERGTGAHGAYNALTRRLVSYLRARERSPHITHAGASEVRHVDFRLQALAQLERSCEQDVADVSQMLDRGLVDRPGLAAAFMQMRPGLFRFPAVDEPTFARRVAEHTQDS